MDLLIKYFFISSIIFFLDGCGVKSRPAPPLIPATIGRGEPFFKRDIQKKEIPAIKKDNFEKSPNESEEQ